MAETDKGRWGYLPTYDTIAEQIGPAGRVCEVGVAAGGSLELWQKYFPEGYIVGVDSDRMARWPEGTTRIVCDQTSPDLPGLLQAASAGFYDLVVDDASHDGTASWRTWELLWPLVRAGGWYVVEDWMIGFASWRGPGEHQPSMMALARLFLGCLERPGEVESVTYRYGQIIIRKSPSCT